jgi:hypothetical protein
MKNQKIKIVYLRVNELIHLQNNPRKKTDLKAISKLKKLIKEHGFQNPLQVYQQDKKFEIICGNHRFDAGIELGMQEFPCIVYTGSKKMALARAISDNKSGLWTDWDDLLLKDFITDLDVGLTGFDVDELSESKEKLIEKNEEIKPYNKTHILLSFNPDKFVEIQKEIEKIMLVEGIDYEQCSN